MQKTWEWVLATLANPADLLKPKTKVLLGKTPLHMFKTVFDN